MLEVGDGEEWGYEFDTDKGGGAHKYVISAKRRSFNEVQISSLDATTSGHAEVVALWAQTAMSSDSPKAVSSSMSASYTEDLESKLNAAFVMGTISILLWCLLVVGLVAKRLLCHHAKTSE
jgi:hypothetical protein